MPATEHACSSCDYVPSRQSAYCPECGAEDPWEERVLYDMSEVSLPVVFPVRVTRYEPILWEAFCEEVFGARLDRADVANVPKSIPKMPELHFETYWVMREDDGPLGPFANRSDARAAVSEMD